MKIFAIILLSCLIFDANADEYESYKISWNPPNEYANGEKLSVKHDLMSYKIYYGPTREEVRQNSVLVDPRLTKFSLSRLNKSVVKDSPIIYLAMTAIAKSGNESDLSEIVFFLP